MSDLLMHPSILFILAALLMPLLKRCGLMRFALIAVPLAAWYQIPQLPQYFGPVQYLGIELLAGRADQLAVVFLYAFAFMALLGGLYSLQVDNPAEHSAAFLYVAGAMGVVLSGDYVTLFVFWELMALASTVLIWQRRTPASRAAGFRYLLVHIAGGLALLAGICLKYQALQTLAFVPSVSGGMGAADWLIMGGFLLNAAVVPLHAWLPDAYPEATVTGAVYLCAFTTKAAVYVLARAFPGSELLAVLGAVMAVYGVCYAIIENDARRILSYHIISQVGIMVCGIGIGTGLALNGACALAFTNVIYKALLFMGVGAVLQSAGTARLSELGGLYRAMPVTLVCTVVGGISISGFPLTSGFISKSMVMAAAGESHRIVLMLVLFLASIGTFLSVGIKLAYCIWFGKPGGREARDPPWNMQLAMVIAAGACFLLGCFPAVLYRLLPAPDAFAPYTLYHLSETLQLLGFTAAGYYLLRRKMAPAPGRYYDFDRLYRAGARAVMWCARRPVGAVNDWICGLYRTAGMRPALGVADVMNLFDRKGIDGFVDSLARHVMHMGELLRRVQTGKVQQYIGTAVILLFLILIGVVLL